MHSIIAKRDSVSRFWDRVLPEPNSGCWLWEGYINDESGYGRLIIDGKKFLAHRYSYEQLIGPIPNRMSLHPAHLLPMSWQDNARYRNISPNPKRVFVSDRRSVIPRSSAPEQRFWFYVKKEADGCWLWQGGTNGRYGVFSIKKKQRYAHRLSYIWAKGTIPDGLTIDHLCRTPLCVNPDHLEAVTQHENNSRAHRRIVCKRGHEWTPENTWIEKNGARHCRKCHALVERNRKRKL